MAKSKWPIVREAIEDGRIEQWLANGQFEKTICKNLGIAVGTWERYKVEHGELREVIKKGNKTIVQKVEDALIKRALGYSYTETKTVMKEDKDGNQTMHVETVEKHLPPDVGAAAFVLKNKDRENWQNDPKMIELRRKELELRKMIAESEGRLWVPADEGADVPNPGTGNNMNPGSGETEGGGSDGQAV